MKLLINKIVEPSLEIMEKWFKERTNKRIELVWHYCKQASITVVKPKDDDAFEAQILLHDLSKFEEPERLAYIYLSYKYKAEREGRIVTLDAETETAIHEATIHHVKTNKHHPEYWSNQNDVINRNNRDEPLKELIDATKMNEISIIEMCCDWCAMSRELGGCPKQWANDNINIRWKFTNKQVTIINNCLDKIWDGE